MTVGAGAEGSTRATVDIYGGDAFLPAPLLPIDVLAAADIEQSAVEWRLLGSHAPNHITAPAGQMLALTLGL